MRVRFNGLAEAAEEMAGDAAVYEVARPSPKQGVPVRTLPACCLVSTVLPSVCHWFVKSNAKIFMSVTECNVFKAEQLIHSGSFRFKAQWREYVQCSEPGSRSNQNFESNMVQPEQFFVSLACLDTEAFKQIRFQ